MFCMHNMVQFFGESTFNIYHWPKDLLRHFVRLFMYNIRTCFTLITLVLLPAHNCFGNHVGNFFQSISQCSIRSIYLQSICRENDDWPNFFQEISTLADQNWNAFSEGWPKAIWPIRNSVNTGRTPPLGSRGPKFPWIG